MLIKKSLGDALFIILIIKKLLEMILLSGSLISFSLFIIISSKINFPVFYLCTQYKQRQKYPLKTKKPPTKSAAVSQRVEIKKLYGGQNSS
jgi:hypothetical protein